MKHYLSILSVILLIACALFWKDVWSIFVGMSVLESMTMIVNFILHVVVATIIGYVAMTLPEFIKPWMRAFRWKQRNTRRGRGRQTMQTYAPTQKQPKLSVSQLLSVLAPNKKITKEPEYSDPEQADLRF